MKAIDRGNFEKGQMEGAKLLATTEHLTCVIGNHPTDGGEEISDIGLVCPSHLEALYRWRHRVSR